MPVVIHPDSAKQTLYSMLKYGAERAGDDRPALAYYGNHISYGQLLDDVHACAAGLRAHGVKRGDFVTIFLPNIPQCVVAVYAVNLIGAVCNMVHPLSTTGETGYAVDLTESKYVLTCEINEAVCSGMDVEIIRCRTPSYFPKTPKGYLMGWMYRRAVRKCLNGENVRRITEWDDLLAEGRAVVAASGIPEMVGSPDDTAVIMYTGGTTGTAKGVMLSNFAVNTVAVQLVVGIGGEDICVGDGFLAILPMFHAFGLAVTAHTPLSAGLKVVLLPRFNAKECAHAILSEKTAYIAGVPAMYERMYSEFEGKDLSFIKLIVAGGDSVSGSLINRYNQLLRQGNCMVKFRPGYGLTEACSVCALTEDGYRTVPTGCVGIPLMGNKVCTVEPGTVNVLPDGEEGELCLFSGAVMTGYYRNQEASEAVLRRHEDGNIWLHTGDIVKITPNGDICFRSRYKRMVKVNGYNVYPMMIEEVMQTHPDVKEVCAIGIPWKHDTRIKLYVTLKRKMDPAEAERKLIEYAMGRLNRWSIPAAVEIVASLPRTKMEKTDYRALEELELRKNASR
ncbi:MAG TPA: class I adenylate-forming enzyme family protein [Methanocorpusculum sp.]|nr:class I adenylate-forming enzyme family protein [Methanocorpusculum sp.]HJK59171.1 class I adenylate-forming enzyme family protein [Methanocorpusculum sp.]